MKVDVKFGKGFCIGIFYKVRPCICIKFCTKNNEIRSCSVGTKLDSSKENTVKVNSKSFLKILRRSHIMPGISSQN